MTNINIFEILNPVLSQVCVSDVPFVCLCEHCPPVPEKDSKCCYSEANIKAAIEKESTSCVINLKKMSKIWDKVA